MSPSPLPAGTPLPPAEARRAVLTVILGEILIQLGLTPVTAVIPALAAALGAGPTEGAWILTVFILALAGALLVSGRLGDLLGHRRIFGVGAGVYAGAALVAGLAPSFETFLAARAAQGVGAAMVSGNNLAIVARAVPPERRGTAIAAVATASSLAAVLGAGLGTLAVTLGAWRVLFLGAVPIALWAALRARRLPGAGPAGGGGPVDWLGAALLALATTLAAVVLNHPHTTVGEATMPVFHVWLPVLAVGAALAFVWVERRVPVPLLDWRQLRNLVFGAAIAVNFALHLTMMAALFLGPVLVVRGLGLDTAAGGMLMVAVQASVVGTAFLGGWAYDRTHSPWLRPGAAAVLALGFAGWAVAGREGSYAGLIAAGFVAGLGSGVLLAVNNTVIMSALPAESRGVASGMLETTRHFGHAFGVSVPAAILALALSAPAGAGGPALRLGFFWACLAMAAVAALAVALALIRPARAAAVAPGGEPAAIRP